MRHIWDLPGVSRSGSSSCCESFGPFLACESFRLLVVSVVQARRPAESRSGSSLCVSRWGFSWREQFGLLGLVGVVRASPCV
eukprot:6133873-Pyramimonas_sp.AAC.1